MHVNLITVQVALSVVFLCAFSTILFYLEEYPMPKTKFQQAVYALITVAITVPLFVWYNLALEMGSMSNAVFQASPKIIAVEVVFAFLIAFFVASPLALKPAFTHFIPQNAHLYVITFVIITVSV